MKKLSDFKGVDGVKILGAILPPIVEAVKKSGYKSGQPINVNTFKQILESAPEELLEVMAALSETPIETYNPSAAEIGLNFMTLVNDKELLSLFTSQERTET